MGIKVSSDGYRFHRSFTGVRKYRGDRHLLKMADCQKYNCKILRTCQVQKNWQCFCFPGDKRFNGCLLISVKFVLIIQ